MNVHAATIDALRTNPAANAAVSYRAGQLGPIQLNELLFPSPYSVSTDEVGDGYYLHLPVIGRFESRHGGVEIVPDRRRVALYQPGTGPFAGRWSGGYRGVCVALAAPAVRDALHRLLTDTPGVLGAQARTRLPVMEPVLPIESGLGRDWAALVFSLRAQMNRDSALLTHPVIAAPLAESVLNGFLLAARHRYSEALHAPAHAAPPASIRAAVELIHAEPHTALTVATLAAHSGVGVRALQNGFRRHLSLSPLAYLREVRLRRAHDDLLAATPGDATVTAIAQRWGFAHLGRFAAAYEARYGHTPSWTLRG